MSMEDTKNDDTNDMEDDSRSMCDDFNPNNMAYLDLSQFMTQNENSKLTQFCFYFFFNNF